MAHTIHTENSGSPIKNVWDDRRDSTFAYNRRGKPQTFLMRGNPSLLRSTCPRRSKSR